MSLSLFVVSKKAGGYSRVREGEPRQVGLDRVVSEIILNHDQKELSHRKHPLNTHSCFL